MRLHPRYRCHSCGNADTVGRTLATTLVRDIRGGLLVDRAGLLVPYCLTCRPRRLVDRIDLDDLLLRDVRYGLHPGAALRRYCRCPVSACTVGRWPPSVGARGAAPCPWCPAPALPDPRRSVGHEEDFAQWSREFRHPIARTS